MLLGSLAGQVRQTQKSLLAVGGEGVKLGVEASLKGGVGVVKGVEKSFGRLASVTRGPFNFVHAACEKKTVSCYSPPSRLVKARYLLRERLLEAD